MRKVIVRLGIAIIVGAGSLFAPGTSFADEASGGISALDQQKVDRMRALVELGREQASNPVAARIGMPRDEPSHGVTRMLQGLAAALAVLFIGVYFVKRKERTRGVSSSRRLQVLERLALTPKHAMVLIECDGQPFLVGCGQERVSVTRIEGKQSFSNYLEPSLSHAPLSAAVEREISDPSASTVGVTQSNGAVQ